MPELSHHLSINPVPDHPDGQVRLSLRDRCLYLTPSDARFLAGELYKVADQLDPPPPVEEPAAEPLNGS